MGSEGSRFVRTAPGALPRYTTSFVGREEESTEVRGSSATHRLVTVVGTGGCGKTRLAVEVAHRTRDEYPDGVRFVDLGTVAAREPELVAESFVAAVEAPESPNGDAPAALIDHLRSRRVLILIDNCEHLLTDVRDLVSLLLKRCPHVRIVATSRSPLGVADEETLALEPLPVPLGDVSVASVQASESGRLFCERAVAARATFALSEENAGAVSSVCSRVDGLPLAVELAAARVKVLSVEEIDRRLGDRFRLLSSGSHEAPMRHQTLRALLDWSFDLLSDRARRVLQRLSVFVDGFDVDAAEAVCSGGGLDATVVLDALAELVDGSLVTVEELHGRARYRFLQTVHGYAADKLGELGDPPAVRARHLAWVNEMTKMAGDQILRERAAEMLDLLDANEGNIRAALDWSITERSGDSALAIVGDMWRYWYTRGRLNEGSRWMELALGAGGFDLAARARVLNAAANLDLVRGSFDAARIRYEEALAIRRQLDDVQGIRTTLNDLGTLHLHAGALAEAQEVLEEGLQLARDAGDEFMQAAALSNLGELAIQRNEGEKAWSLLGSALPIWRSIEFDEGIAHTLLNLAVACRLEGDVEGARATLDKALRHLQRLGHEPSIVMALRVSASVELLAGEHERAATLLGADEGSRALLGILLGDGERDEVAEATETLREHLSDDAFDAAYRRGRDLDLAASVAFALGEGPDVESPPSGTSENVFCRHGDYWTLAYEGIEVRLRDAKGLLYIAQLLSRPGEEFHSAELASVSSGTVPVVDAKADGLEVGPLGSAGELIDPQARDAYRARLVDLHEELNEAEAWNDTERAGRAREEMDVISAELSTAFGLGGRARKGADAAERVRKAVTNRIRASIAKIERAHPRLGHHLSAAVKTGTFCSYAPPESTVWVVR